MSEAPELVRCRRIMLLGCGGMLCALALIACAVALAVAAHTSAEGALYFLAVTLGIVGVVGLVGASGANVYGFARYWAVRLSSQDRRP